MSFFFGKNLTFINFVCFRKYNLFIGNYNYLDEAACYNRERNEMKSNGSQEARVLPLNFSFSDTLH